MGVILAVAGGAVGLGNFVRFPGQVAQYGGGAFMVAYLVAFLLLGLPICWVEWTMGRRGGSFGAHSCPSILVVLTRCSRMRYAGLLQMLVPVIIYMYYVNIEAWCLGYAVNFCSGAMDFDMVADSGAFFGRFVGITGNGDGFGFGLGHVGTYLTLCFVVNFVLIYRGISRGIEWFCKYAMPMLFLLAVIVLVRVLTLGTPNLARPHDNVMNGLGFMWNPEKVLLEKQVFNEAGRAEWVLERELIGEEAIAEARALARNNPVRRVVVRDMWTQLRNPQLWVAAAGQIFFSLSVGFGLILTYASYLKKDDDIVLSGLAATSANEFAEISLGGLITIPAAVAFLGVAGVAGMGTFGLGFNVLPLVFSQMPGGALFGALFFFLLFLAAVTSSLSLLQPGIAFLEESMHITRRQSVAILGYVTAVGASFVAYFSKDLKALDTIDFWVGTFMVFVLASMQIVVFSWVMGIDRGMAEMRRGAAIGVPGAYRFILRWVTPLFLLTVFGMWIYFELLNMDGGDVSAYVRDIFIVQDKVALLSLAMLALVLGLGLLLMRSRAHYEQVADRAAKEEGRR